MDPFVHGTISALAIGKKAGWSRKIIPYIVFGILPDAYGITSFLLVIIGLKTVVLDEFFFVQYDITHSLLFFVIVWALLSWRRKKIYWPFIMYGLHIATDLISHQIYGTPIFWPFMDNWIKGWFEYTDLNVLIITYALMVPVWGFILLSRVTKNK